MAQAHLLHFVLESEVDESWPFVGSKQRQRWLWWVEDAKTGEVVAFVSGQRTHQTSRALVALLEESRIEVGRRITDAWCRVAGAGLLRLLIDSVGGQNLVTKPGT